MTKRDRVRTFFLFAACLEPASLLRFPFVFARLSLPFLPFPFTNAFLFSAQTGACAACRSKETEKRLGRARVDRNCVFVSRFRRQRAKDLLLGETGERHEKEEEGIGMKERVSLH